MSCHTGRVVDEVARREVVGAVDDHVPAVAEDPLDVLGGQPLLVGTTSTSGLSASIVRFAESTFGSPSRSVAVDDLALEVRVVDDVGVDDAERADAGRREVERRGRAEPAGADQQDRESSSFSWPSSPTSGIRRWRL